MQDSEIKFPPNPNARQNKHRTGFQGVGSSRSKCVLCRTECHAPSIVRGLPGLLGAGLRRMPLVCGFVLETHNLLHRMVLRYKRRYGAFWIFVGALSQTGPTGHPEPNTRTHACISDMRSFGQRNPWATILDLEAYRDGWQAGAEWAENNSCISVQGNQKTAPHATSAADLGTKL